MAFPQQRTVPPPLPGTPPAKPAEPKSSLLTIEELERFKNLVVFAKSTVEGYFTGKHKSPFYGSSVEFADYKEYVPGDDPGRIDWRAFGRTRRLMVRQFEEETDMVVYLLVDTSASMRYGGEKRQSKFYLAAKVAAALAYLMIRQGDKAALALFADRVTEFVPPGGTRRHMHRIVSHLEMVKPASTTGLVHSLQECASIFKKRGRLVILSDFLTPTDRLFEVLGQFLHRKFEILLLHVVDPDEIHLPAATVARFVDMETGEQVEVDPEEIRAAYRANVQASLKALAQGANQRRIDHSVVDTQEPYLTAIEAYLGFRGNNTMFGQP
ncbi:MAG: DUF58 domain-containing protein [Verrucomicrobiota bacterium]